MYYIICLYASKLPTMVTIATMTYDAHKLTWSWKELFCAADSIERITELMKIKIKKKTNSFRKINFIIKLSYVFQKI